MGGNGRPVNAVIKWQEKAGQVIRVSNGTGYSLIELGDLGDRDDMKALGLFEYSGVVAHPEDHGMQKIADRIWDCLRLSCDLQSIPVKQLPVTELQ